jgi:hypothetical protein
MKRAAKERNKRNSERLLALSDLGKHPWQQPHFIERNRKRLLTLSALGKHPWQQPNFIEQHIIRHLALSDIGEHNLQREDVIEQNRERELTLSDIGEHNFQRPELIEQNREQNSLRQLALSDIGEHNFQHEDVSMLVSKNQREKISNGTHNFQLAKKERRAAATGGTGPWTDEEDRKLTMLVSEHGIVYGTWIKIAKEIPGECSLPSL